DVFRGPVPRDLIGRTLKEAAVREQTGCSVVAIEMDDQTIVNPPPDMPLPNSPDAEIIVIGTTESEQRFHKRYLAEASPKRKVVRI
ncbi:MAG: cation:proton antiporter regulatory subunit, partial [Longimicrobiales bacterium]